MKTQKELDEIQHTLEWLGQLNALATPAPWEAEEPQDDELADLLAVGKHAVTSLISENGLMKEEDACYIAAVHTNFQTLLSLALKGLDALKAEAGSAVKAKALQRGETVTIEVTVVEVIPHEETVTPYQIKFADGREAWVEPQALGALHPGKEDR